MAAVEDNEGICVIDDSPEARKETTCQPLFSPLSGNELQCRLDEKYKTLYDSESDEELPTTAKKHPWKTKPRTLLTPEDDEWKNSSPKHKPPVVSRASPRKRSITPKRAKMSCPNKACPATSAEKAVTVETRPAMTTKRPIIVTSDDLTESSEESVYAPSQSSGFSDSELERPRFKDVVTDCNEPLVLSDVNENPRVQVPQTTNRYLREYQREGVKFIYSHYKTNTGALLADDMGLGKTIQVISLISAVLGKTGNKSDFLKQRPLFIRKLSEEDADNQDLESHERTRQVFLIIGPASVLYNWVEEFETWGYFSVGKFHRQHRNQSLLDLQKGKLDVLVTTYETFRDYVNDLNSIEWAAVFADEAHRIKGMKAKTTDALKTLKCRKRFGLTGTAMQNELLELWCILDWCNPNCLGPSENFVKKFSKVIEKGQKQHATKRELAEARKMKEKLSELRSNSMLRRTKAIISHQLPKKTELVVFCRLPSFQETIYKAILSHDAVKFILNRNKPCDCWSGKTRSDCCYKKLNGLKVRSLILQMMHLLLKASNHTALLIPRQFSTSNLQQKLCKDVCETAFSQHSQFVGLPIQVAYRTLSDPQYCGKMEVLQGMLAVFKKQKSKVLLFSYSTQVLSILEQYVISVGYEYRRLDGKTPNVQRMEIVREFNKDPNIFLFLISTRAGGVGLNLTGANVVLIFDPNWNPTHDLQAQDRAYRIGQCRAVQVYRLICAGTIEENIYLRQIYKQQLDNVAVDSGNARRYFKGIRGDCKNKGELFGVENMFEFRSGDQVITNDILKRHDDIEKGLRGFSMNRYIAPTLSDSESSYTGSGSDGSVEDMSTDSDMSESEMEERRSKRLRQLRSQRKVIADMSASDEDSPAKPSTSGAHRSHATAPSTSRGSGSTARAPRSTAAAASNSRTPSGKRRYRKRVDVTSSSSDSDAETGAKVTKSLLLVSDASRAHNEVRLPCTVSNVLNESVEDVMSTIDSLLDDDGNADPGVPESSDSLVEVTNNAGGADGAGSRAGSGGGGAGGADIDGSVDSVSDVFARCGVLHTHANRSVIGASRIEDHMTKCALTDVFDKHQQSQMPAMQCDPCSEASEEDSESSRGSAAVVHPPKKSRKSKDEDVPRAVMLGKQKVLIGQTPAAIKRQHFQQMATFLDVSDLSEFADRVISMSSEERCELLRNFYISQNAALAPACDALKTNVERAKVKSDKDAKIRDHQSPLGENIKIAPVKQPKTMLKKKSSPVVKKEIKSVRIMSNSDDDAQIGDLAAISSKTYKSFPSRQCDIDIKNLNSVTDSVDQQEVFDILDDICGDSNTNSVAMKPPEFSAKSPHKSSKLKTESSDESNTEDFLNDLFDMSESVKSGSPVKRKIPSRRSPRKVPLSSPSPKRPVITSTFMDEDSWDLSDFESALTVDNTWSPHKHKRQSPKL